MLNANVNIVDYANTILADTECATYTLSERYLMYYMLTYAQEAVKVANKLGILIGYEDDSFGPQRNATRAEAAALFVRLLNAIK